MYKPVKQIAKAFIVCICFVGHAKAQYTNTEKEILQPVKNIADSLLYRSAYNALSPLAMQKRLKEKTSSAHTLAGIEVAANDGNALPAGKIYENALPAVAVVAMCSRPNPLRDIIVNPATAFVIAENGICVTNFHVLHAYANTQTPDGRAVFLIRTGNGKIYPLKTVLAFSANDDIAIIQVDTYGDKLPFLSLSKTDAEVGDDIYVLGNPESLFFNFTKGIVSNKYNNSIPMPGEYGIASRNTMVITADYAIGSSGSPVINSKGKVAGITSSTYVIEQNNTGHAQTQMVIKNTVPASSVLKLISENK